MDNVISTAFEDDATQNVYASLVKENKNKSRAQLEYEIKELTKSKLRLVAQSRKQEKEYQDYVVSSRKMQAEANRSLSEEEKKRINKQNKKPFEEVLKITPEERANESEEIKKWRRDRELTLQQTLKGII